MELGAQVSDDVRVAVLGSPGRSCCSPKIRTETKNSVGTIVARRCSR
jgi:hypothetical protein